MDNEEDYLSLFRMPTPMKITGRSSSITNSFVNSIIPIIKPTSEQVKEALKILGMDLDSFQCSYCGSKATEWDHLRPIVKNKKPTGYISEIHNLVPACGKCNQSKGNKRWNEWINSSAKLSPKTKNVKDLDARVLRLQKYEKWIDPTVVDFESIIGSAKWNNHWDNCENVQSTMRHAQVLASEINANVSAFYALETKPCLNKINMEKSGQNLVIQSNSDFIKLDRIEGWAKRPQQINSKIILAYLELEQKGQVSLSELRECCTNKAGINDFNGNFASMKTDSAKSHGKVFLKTRGL